jgi:hypothetical protein
LASWISLASFPYLTSNVEYAVIRGLEYCLHVRYGELSLNRGQIARFGTGLRSNNAIAKDLASYHSVGWLED